MSKARFHSQSYTTIREPEIKTSQAGNVYCKVLAKGKDGKLRELILFAKTVEEAPFVEGFFQATERIGNIVLVSGSVAEDGSIFVNYFENEKTQEDKIENNSTLNNLIKIEYIEMPDCIKTLEHYPNRIVSYFEPLDRFSRDLWGKLQRLDTEILETLGEAHTKKLYAEAYKTIPINKGEKFTLSDEVRKRFNRIKSAIELQTE